MFTKVRRVLNFCRMYFGGMKKTRKLLENDYGQILLGKIIGR